MPEWAQVLVFTVMWMELLTILVMGIKLKEISKRNKRLDNQLFRAYDNVGMKLVIRVKRCRDG